MRFDRCPLCDDTGIVNGAPCAYCDQHDVSIALLAALVLGGALAWWGLVVLASHLLT